MKCMPHFISTYTVYKMEQIVNRSCKQRKGQTIIKEDKYVLSISKLMTLSRIVLAIFPYFHIFCLKLSSQTLSIL